MTTPVKAPPKPTYAPDVHLKGSRGARKPPRTLKGDLRVLRGKLSSIRRNWNEGRISAEQKRKEVRREAEQILAPAKEKITEEGRLAGEVMKPVLRGVAAARGALRSGNRRTRPYVNSFMISLAAAWVVSPSQLLTALYERIKFGTSTTDWGFMHGPGRWFRDTVKMAVETGQVFGLVAAICLGLTPMFLFTVRNMTVNYLAQSSYRGRLAEFTVRWLSRAPYLVPAVYLIGVSYPDQITWLFGSPWELTWWQFWVAGLFCTAYYCTLWALDRAEKGLGLGFTHVLLMIPMASIASCVLYAPNAAW